MHNKQNFQKNQPVTITFTEYLPDPIIDQASATVRYVGDAPLGTRLNEPGWRIRRITISGAVTVTEYASGTMDFINAWTERVTLPYSR